MKFLRIIGVFLASLMFVLSWSAVSAKNSSKNEQRAEQSQVTGHNTEAANLDMQSAESLKVQKFTLRGSEQLGVEFRYVDDRLKYVYLWNLAEPVEVELFSQLHVIGTNNDLQVDVPNVKKMVIAVEPYLPTVSDTPGLDAFTKVYLFSLGDDGFYRLHTKFN